MQQVNGCRSDSIDFGTNSLAEHRVRYHKSKGFQRTKFPCDKCPTSYSRRACLEKHQRQAHDENLPFGCDLCQFRGLTQQSIAMHKGFHHSSKNYPCPNGCGEYFKGKFYSIAHAKRYCSKITNKAELLAAELEDGR